MFSRVLSLMFWALLMIVGLKYLVFVFQADNHGEGGEIALNRPDSWTKHIFSGTAGAWCRHLGPICDVPPLWGRDDHPEVKKIMNCW